MSPLANIVLYQLDTFPERTRKEKVCSSRKKEKRKILTRMRSLRRSDLFDRNFRLTYIRYADDFVVLLVGRPEKCEIYKKEVLKSKCGLDLNDEKTTINSMTDKWNFLGGEQKSERVNNSFLIKQGQTRRAIGRVSSSVETILNKGRKINKGKY